MEDPTHPKISGLQKVWVWVPFSSLKRHGDASGSCIAMLLKTLTKCNPVRVPPCRAVGCSAHTHTHSRTPFPRALGYRAKSVLHPPPGGLLHLHSLNGQECCLSKAVALHGGVAATLSRVALHFATQLKSSADDVTLLTASLGIPFRALPTCSAMCELLRYITLKGFATVLPRHVTF